MQSRWGVRWKIAVLSKSLSGAWKSEPLQRPRRYDLSCLLFGVHFPKKYFYLDKGEYLSLTSDFTSIYWLSIWQWTMCEKREQSDRTCRRGIQAHLFPAVNWVVHILQDKWQQKGKAIVQNATVLMGHQRRPYMVCGLVGARRKEKKTNNKEWSSGISTIVDIGDHTHCVDQVAKGLSQSCL